VLDTIPWARDLAAVADEFGPRVAVSDGTHDLSFREMAGRGGRLAQLLLARGVVPGTPVATSLRNSLPAVWATVGLRIAGAGDTPLNAAMSEAERRYSLDLSGAKLVVTTRDQAPAFAALGCEVIAVEDVPEGDGDLAALANVPGAAAGRISFTSGTTGRPKAIVTTHGARFIANLLQRASFAHMPGPGSFVLLMTPFVHGAGILTQAFNDRGGAALLLDGVDLAAVRAALDGGRVDHIFAPPTVLAKILGAYEGRRVEGIRTIFCGTAPLLPGLYAKARAVFGPVIRVTYGKSEITNPIATLSPAETDAYYAGPMEEEGVCVGFPGTGVEIETRDEAGVRLPRGEVGEVQRFCAVAARRFPRHRRLWPDRCARPAASGRPGCRRDQIRRLQNPSGRDRAQPVRHRRHTGGGDCFVTIRILGRDYRGGCRNR
jgi:acyl-CoA synthetase (AMP-forming)/AMP-acid ligase II